MKKSSLRSGILVPAVASLVLTAALVAGILTTLAVRDLRTVLDDRVAHAVQVLENDWASRRKTLEASILWFTNSGRAIQLLGANDHPGAVDFGKLAMSSFGTDFFILAQADGTVLARAQDPGSWGDSIAGQALVQGALRKESAVALASGTDAKLSLLGAVPVLTAKGDLAGVVMTGFVLSQDTYVDSLKTLLGAEVTIFGGKTRLATSLVDASGRRIVGTDLANTQIVDQVLGQGKPYYGTNTIGGRSYAAVYVPVRDDGGAPVGMLFAGLPLDRVEQSTRSLLLTASVLTVVLALVASLVLAVFLQGRIIRPLVQTASDLAGMGEGRPPSLDRVRLDRTDEIGEMTRSLEGLAAYLAAGTEVAAAIAEGNLDVRPQAAGPEDRFGLALVSMSDELNRLIGQLRSSAEGVLQGVGQIADGTGALSAGASEGAASLEEMGATFEELVRSSEKNTREAREASAYAATVSANARDSRREMGNLLEAMGTIEASAKDIRTIVKVIDDIAFQVNLLALNANVEAARAGKYGKGFGVVAEEVRSLAKRSAVAAQDTSKMVDEALRRIGTGAEIARTTGQVLEGMAASIDQVTAALDRLAQSSTGQNEGLKQVNTGMGQLSQVTQTNAATAEQSASVSQEIRSAAEDLGRAAGRFRLRS